MKYELNLPFNWDEETANKVNNGCGTDGWKGKVVPDTMYGLDISEACKVHDFEYFFGRHSIDKIRADDRFLKNLNLIIDQGVKHTKFLNFLRRRRAYKYYLAVKHFGEKAFLYGKNGIKEKGEM